MNKTFTSILILMFAIGVPVGIILATIVMQGG